MFAGVGIALTSCGQRLDAGEFDAGLPPECEGDAEHCRALTSIAGISVYANHWPNGFCPDPSSCTRPPGRYGSRWQCGELFNRYLAIRHGTQPLPGNARDFFANAERNVRLTTHHNGGPVPPRPGDGLVFDDGSEGHVAIVSRLDPGWVHVVEQNVPGNGVGRYRYDPIANTVAAPAGTTARVLGWIRPATPPLPLQEPGV